MTLLVVGSTAFDTIETPHGNAERCLGGSSTYFGLAARLFSPVRLVSVVGEDFPAEHKQLLSDRDIDLDGLEVKEGKTFAWHGRYSADMNQRDTIDVQLNTFGDFEPKVPSNYRDSKFVFLANGSPAAQSSVVEQMNDPQFVVADTMGLWIDSERDGLLALLKRIDGVIVNDSEVKSLTGESNLIAAGKAALEEATREVKLRQKATVQYPSLSEARAVALRRTEYTFVQLRRLEHRSQLNCLFRSKDLNCNA